MHSIDHIQVRGACEHNLKDISVSIERGKMTVITGVSGSGKSSLAFDTILAEAQRRFFYTLSHYSRQFLDLGSRPAVQFMAGLSPAIALAQNETQPSRRATVGTLTDISELLAVMFAQFGTQHCPEHDLITGALSIGEIVETIFANFAGETVLICAPIAEKKKGNFATRLEKIAARGFMRAIIDDKLRNLQPVPQLIKEEKHTIKVIVDQLTVTPKSRDRLRRSLEAALVEADGFGELVPLDKDAKPKLAAAQRFSTKAGCRVCGYSWPKLDSRYFSANSLGKCLDCDGYGHREIDAAEFPDDYLVEDDLDHAECTCSACNGTGLSTNLRAIRLQDKSIIDLQASSLASVHEFLQATAGLEPYAANGAFQRVYTEINSALGRILEVGLNYLSLSRRVRTLSGGEAQRLKLAGILSESLRGVLYVLDEPSQGLHPIELKRLVASLYHLRDLGNTLVIVDHDETIMRAADWIIDLGPGGGARGGELMARFAPQQAKAFSKQSVTAAFLARPSVMTTKASTKKVAQAPRGYITIHDASLYNLQIERVRFPVGQMSIVSGVSGAGKTSLARSVLYENIQDLFELEANGRAQRFRYRGCSKITGIDELEMVWLVDRRPVAKSSVSMPASYLDIFSDIRTLFAELPEAQVAGLTQRSFSLQVEGGRCDECKGRGEINLQMRFLADARVRCSRCKGKRYRPEVLEVRFGGLNLAEILNLTLDEAMEHFKTFKRIQKHLQPAIDLGLGYLKLGQPSASLSGGEAQRLKLVPLLAKKHGAGSLLVIDEPTTGLHFEDVLRLTKCLRQLVDDGATVVVIEHNVDVIARSDWVVELGPGAAAQGGRVVYEGLPRQAVVS